MPAGGACGAGRHRRRAGLVRDARPSAGTDRSPTGSPGPGSCSPTASPERRGSGPRSRPDDAADDVVTARVLLCAGWLEASAGDLGIAQADLDRAARIIERPGRRRPGRRPPASPGLRLHPAGQAARCPRERRRRLETYRALRQDWPAAASLLLAAFGSLMLGDTGAARRDADEAVHLLAPLGDAWGTVHAQAMLGSIAEAEKRRDDAVRALAAAADASAASASPARPHCTARASPACSTGRVTRKRTRRTDARSPRPSRAGTAGCCPRRGCTMQAAPGARGPRRRAGAGRGERAVVRRGRRWRLRAAQQGRAWPRSATTGTRSRC